MTQKKVGLALSGGGARGLAHIGVLEALEQAGIRVDCIAGASMGGIIGALYAAGMSPHDLHLAAVSKSRFSELIRLADFSGLRRGLFEGNRIRAMMSQWLGENRTFKDLKIPLALSAVDLQTSKEITITEGDLLQAVMATSAFPGVFPPVQYNGYQLIDGGVLNNLPIDRVREIGAETVVAVDVLFQACDVAADWKFPIAAPGWFVEFYRAEMIMQAEYSRLKIEQSQPDVLICPAIPPEVTIFIGFTYAERIIQAGNEAVRRMLPLIRHYL